MKGITIRLNRNQMLALVDLMTHISRYCTPQTLTDQAARNILAKLYLRLVGRRLNLKPVNSLMLKTEECWALLQQTEGGFTSYYEDVILNLVASEINSKI